MVDQPQRQKPGLLKKVQLFFLFLLLLTAGLWIMNGRVTNADQLHSRLAIGIIETIGLAATTFMLMRKK